MLTQRAPVLILIRHGQTDWNIARRYQGQTETDLNGTGIAQMSCAANRLKDQPVNAVVASPLRRAAESAKIVARPHRLPVQTDPNLNELFLGAWQGKPYSLRDQNQNWFELAPHGGESGAAFCSRIRTWFENYRFEPESRTILVSHGLVIQVLLVLVSGQSFEYWHSQPIKNGALTVLNRVDGCWSIERFNDDQHLKQME